MSKVYVGCALVQASENFKAEIESFKDSLRKEFEVLDFWGLRPGEAGDVYRFDIQNLDQCDLFVADVSEPSTGLGFEIAYALSNNKRVLAMARSRAKVSRMIQGIDDPHFTFVRYEQMSDLLPSIKRVLSL